jgi:TonB family protein
MTDLKIIARCVLMLAGAAASPLTMAQVTAPSAAASAAAERAQKESERTMYWIRVLATTPVPKPPAAPKPVAAVEPRAKVAAAPERAVERAPAPAPERVKVAAAAAAPAPTSADVANAAPSSVVVAAPPVAAAPPAAAAPSLAAATGTGNPGNASAMNPGSLEAGVSSAGVAGALAAPTTAPPQIDVPVAEEEPDPGLIMIKSADPQFPAATMRRLRKGEVKVQFEVSPEGVVNVVSVVKTTSPGLNTAAVDAVRQWRFKPTPKGHTAMVDLAFNLDE